MSTLLHTKRAIEKALGEPVRFVRTTVDVELRVDSDWETLACGATHIEAAETALEVALARKRADDRDCAGDYAYDQRKDSRR